jgi:hypothetical protein
MRKSDINKQIMDQIDEVEDADRKQFLKEALAFERSKMDRDQPHYKDSYDDLIQKYAISESAD